MPPKGKKGKKPGGAAEPEESKGPGKLKAAKQFLISFVKARHILCEKQSKLLEAYDQLREQHGDRPPAAEFSRVIFPQLAAQYSECSSGKKGGDLGWFPRGKMVGAFQDVAFATEPGTMSAPFRTA